MRVGRPDRDHSPSSREPSRVVGVDPSADFVDHARASDRRRAGAVHGRRRSAPSRRPSRPRDYVVSGLVLNFIPDPDAALAEMSRVATAGATIAAYVWDYADGMQMLRAFWDAAVALDPDAADLDESTRFPLCRPEPLRRLFEDGGTGRSRAERHHGGHHLHRLRRLLDAVPQRPGSGARLLRVPARRRPGPVARPPSRPSSHPTVARSPSRRGPGRSRGSEPDRSCHSRD